MHKLKFYGPPILKMCFLIFHVSSIFTPAIPTSHFDSIPIWEKSHFLVAEIHIFIVEATHCHRIVLTTTIGSVPNITFTRIHMIYCDEQQAVTFLHSIFSKTNKITILPSALRVGGPTTGCLIAEINIWLSISVNASCNPIETVRISVNDLVDLNILGTLNNWNMSLKSIFIRQKIKEKVMVTSKFSSISWRVNINFLGLVFTISRLLVRDVFSLKSQYHQ